MKAVLISIKPKLCTLIASGEKTIEVRKTRPKMETPFKCYIYETKRKSDVPVWMDEDGHASYEIGGKVIGEFVCDEIENMYENIISGKGNEHIKKGGCLSGKDLNFYAKGKIIFAWHISNLKIYDEPKEIGEFRKPNIPINGTRETESGGVVFFDGYKEGEKIIIPPQSWCYVEELI